MNSADTNQVLNYLYVLHHRSLASYMQYAEPWTDGDDDALEVLENIVSDHGRTAARIGDLILENDGDVTAGEYPMYFTGFHDLSIDFLVKQLIKEQKKLISEIEKCVEQLQMAPLAKGLAEESLGEAKGHLQSLQELTEAKA